MGKQKMPFNDAKSAKRVKLGVLPEDTLNYYRRVSETLTEGFENDSDKSLFLDNVLSQLEEEAVKVAQNQTCSSILESLILQSSVSHLNKFFHIFSKDWEIICTDRFASHVLQTVLTYLPICFGDASNVDSEIRTESNICEEFSLFCTFIREHLQDFVEHTYASHILRSLFEVLGGVSVSEQVLRSSASQQYNKESHKKVEHCTPPEEFGKILKKYAAAIFKRPNISEEFSNATLNPVIQTLLHVLKTSDPKRCDKYCKKVAKLSGLLSSSDGDGSERLPEIVQSKVGSFLVDQILCLATEVLFDKIHKALFKGRLLQFAVHPVANCILQKLFSNVKDKQQFEEMFDEISPNLEDILAKGHAGMVTRLADACFRHGCRQEKMLKMLEKAFHCSEPEERQAKFVVLLGSLTTYDVFYHTDEPSEADKTESPTNKSYVLEDINYHGSVLLQSLMRFGNPKRIVSGLLELQSAELSVFACNPCGSHVIDAFFQSNSVGEKSREAMYNRLQGLYVTLACNSHGSRVLESMWKVATVKQKAIIAEDVIKQEAKVRGNRFGQFIHRNFALYHFVNRREEWFNMQGSQTKKRKMFQDIFDDKGPSSQNKNSLQIKPNVQSTKRKFQDADIAGSEKRRRGPYYGSFRSKQKS